jgi:hypothetical protein
MLIKPSSHRRLIQTFPLLVGVLFPSLLLAQINGSSESKAPQSSQQSAASVGVTVVFLPTTPDIARRRDTTDAAGNTIEAKSYSVLDSQFHLDFQMNRSEDFSSAIRASLGFRNAFDRMDSEYPSTEYTGYLLAYRQNLSKNFLLDLRFLDRRSDGLRLTSKHYSIEASLSFEISDSLGESKSSLVSLRVQPNIAASKTYGDDAQDIYDPRWGAGAEIKYLSRDGAGFPIAFAIEGLFQRTMGYRLDGQDHGGAGLMTVIPKIESMMSQQLWVGAYVNVPTLRPVGREESFNDPSLPGLYGHSAGFYVKSMSF